MNGLEQADQILQGMDIGVPAGQPLSVMQGQTIRMTVAFSYRGKALSCTLRCAIGLRTAGILSIKASATKPLNIPESVNFENYTAFADISTAACSPYTGFIYDIEAKILEYGDQAFAEMDNVIEVVGKPEFQNFAITSYDVV